MGLRSGFRRLRRRIADNPLAAVATGGALMGGAGALTAGVIGASGLLTGADSGAKDFSAQLAPLSNFISGGKDEDNSLANRVAGINSGLLGRLDNLNVRNETHTLDPFRLAGNAGLDLQRTTNQNIAGLLENPSNILDDPLIQQQLRRGIQSAELGAGAAGGQLSGGQLAELNQFGNEFAGTQINQQLARLQTLSGLAGQEADRGLNAVGIGINANLDAQKANQQAQLQSAGLLSQTQLAGLGLEGGLAAQLAQAQSASALGAANTEAAEDAAGLGFFGQVLGVGAGLLGRSVSSPSSSQGATGITNRGTVSRG